MSSNWTQRTDMKNTLYIQFLGPRVPNCYPLRSTIFTIWQLSPLLKFQSATFLALLDYVSRAREIEICPSPVVCVAIISEPIEQIPFKFQLWLPLGHTPRRFLNFWKKCIFKFFRKCFGFRVDIESKHQNATPPSNHFFFNPFKFFSKFAPEWSLKKYSFGCLKFRVYFFFLRFVFIFVNMGPYESQNLKRLLLPQITFESFPIFFWVFLTKVFFLIFELCVWFFTIFVRFR